MKQHTYYTTSQINHNKFQDFPLNISFPKNKSNLVGSTHPQNQISDNKKKFLQWLKIMNINERLQRFTFTNKCFTLLLLQMFDRKSLYSQNSFQIQREIESNTLILIGNKSPSKAENKDQSQAETELIKNLLIISREQLYDSISLNQRLLCNLQKIFELFASLEESLSFQITIQQYKQLEKEEKDIYFYILKNNIGTTKSIGQWLVNIFKIQIWVEYYNQYYQFEQEKKYKQKKKLNKIWKQLDFEKKMELIQMPPYQEIIQILAKQKKDQKINQLSLFKTQFPTDYQIDCYIKSLNLHNQIDIFQFLTEYSILEASQKLTCIKWIIFLEIRKLLIDKESRNKKKNKSKFNNKKKKFQKCQTIENDLFDQKKIEKPSKFIQVSQKEYLQNQRINKFVKQQIKDAIKNDFRSNQNKIIREKKTKKYIQVLKSQEKSPQTIQKNQKSVASNQTNQTIVFCQEQIFKFSQEQIQQRKKIIQKIYQQKLKSDISQTADHISETANSYTSYRIIAYNRIQYLLQSWGVQLKIFGSCATGLALANSDIDLAVDSSVLNYFYYTYGSSRDKICAALTSIYQLLQTRTWVMNLKLILTAFIPVLKFEINTQIPFQESSTDPFLNLTNEKQKNKKVVIKVDLTIEYFINGLQQCNHLGIMATNYMNEWMKQYICLNTVSIIIKYLLKKKQLNNVYKGGLSTYCIMIMVIAYLQIKKLKDQTNISKVFYGFLQYYAEQFKNEKNGVDIRNQNNPLFELDVSQSSKIQVKDPLNGKIISMNSYQYQKIIQEFKCVIGLKMKIFDQVNSYLTNPEIKLAEGHKYFTKNLLQEYLN